MATVWVVRGGDRHQLVPMLLDDGDIGVEFPMLEDGRELDRAAVLRRLGRVDPDASDNAREQDAKMFLSFVRRMAIGDIVAMPDPAAGGVGFGVIDGAYRFDDERDASRARHRRAVTWCRRLATDDLPERLAHVPRTRSVLDDPADGRLRALAEQCCRGEAGTDPSVRPTVARRAPGTGTPRRRTPPRPPKATVAERRCAGCLVVKPDGLFDDDGGDYCQDCR